jgi:hypothetical protein
MIKGTVLPDLSEQDLKKIDKSIKCAAFTISTKLILKK